MDRSSPPFRSLDEANAEIARLHARIARLERELASARRDMPVHADASAQRSPPTGGDRMPLLDADANPLEALEQFAEQIEAVRNFWKDTTKGGAATRVPVPADFDDVIATAEDQADRRLGELRQAIHKLREDRAQASMELLQLTRLSHPNPGPRPATPASRPAIDTPTGPARPVLREIADTATRSMDEVARPATRERIPDGGWAMPPGGVGETADAASFETLSDTGGATGDVTGFVEPPAAVEPLFEPEPPATPAVATPRAVSRDEPATVSVLEAVGDEAGGRALLEREMAGEDAAFLSETPAEPTAPDAPAGPQPERATSRYWDAADPVASANGGSPTTGGPRRVILITVVLGCLVLAGFWWYSSSSALPPWLDRYFQGFQAWRGASTPSGRTAATSAPPGRTSPAPAPPTAPDPEAAGVPADDAVATPPTPSGHRLELTILRDVWLDVSADGARSSRGIFAAGEILRLDVLRRVEIRAGDAGAVRVAIDGASRGPLGADGAVVTRAFDLTTPHVR